MHFLVAINDNLDEWKESFRAGGCRPRLPLVYPFAAALVGRGNTVSAIDVSSRTHTVGSSGPFTRVFHLHQMFDALKGADVAALWGGLGISGVAKQLWLPSPRRRVLLCSYVWRSRNGFDWQAKKLETATRLAARWARVVVLMTDEQASMARQDLAAAVPVVQLRCGIDTRYYVQPADEQCIPETYRRVVDQLRKSAYVIMPGDELRCNDAALEIVAKSGLTLVRISQYPGKSGTERLKRRIQEERLSGRVVLFEGISYEFVRFLLQHASAYAGLVDSRWQPAGWTVACEALATGIPVVVYEGLVARELERLGAPSECVRVIPMHDTQSFRHALADFSASRADDDRATRSREFAAARLDLEQTGEEFALLLESSLG